MTTFARYLWLLIAAIALPAWVHWPYVVGEIDLASVEIMTSTRFLFELALSTSFGFVLLVLPWSLWLRRRQRRRGVLPRDAWIATTAMASATLLGLHSNMTMYAPFYGNTWALWEPTFELFLPHALSVLAILALTIALEGISAQRSLRAGMSASASSGRS
ncbi:hypothetical protein [Lysobacter antibioticus]|uniref:Transmembrane protein n=1 Tax=Lysobacter antibioticus TaxID=84531 RepID=A0A0S2FIE7_LYSAN|nr:hypothetical protein [Lysobacter antibioticus]ALN83265.1 hypothetical protein LA76x_5163 [Lysobacter antibioticus]